MWIPSPIQSVLDAQSVPVITPIGMGEDGKLYNINADEAAASIARALRARKLVFLSDVPGLLADPGDTRIDHYPYRNGQRGDDDSRWRAPGGHDSQDALRGEDD